MTRKQILWAAALLLGGTVGTALYAAEPQPIWDYDLFHPGKTAQETELIFDKGSTLMSGVLAVNGSQGATIRTKNTEAFLRKMKESLPRQLGIAATLRFDEPAKADEAQVDFGFFLCRRTADGRLEVTLLPGRTEIQVSPLVLTSQIKIEPGKWYDIAINFSAERRRYTMYINGAWQMDNAIPKTPETIRRNPIDIKGFQGAITRLTVYDMAMDSEELTPSEITEPDRKALSERAATLEGSGNAAVGAWGKELSRRIREVGELQKERKASIARVKRIARDLANAEQLAPLAGKDRSFVTYTVPSTSQEMYLPYSLPKDGQVQKTIRWFAAQGENTFASVVVVPLRPADRFTVRFTELRNSKGQGFPAANVDAKLVKRWYRAGGAWMTYHADRLSRILTPDLLLYDDSIVRVDEFRQSNERLLHLADGTRYVDVGRAEYDRYEFYMRGDVKVPPIRDAETLQPLTLPEAGRNQQYLFTFQVPKDLQPGTYTGKLELVADGTTADTLDVQFRVLPFQLPMAKTYYDLNRTYFSHINLQSPKTPEELRAILKVLMKYNLFHGNGMVDAAWKIKVAQEMGYPLEENIGTAVPTGKDWLSFWGGDSREITDEAAAKMDELFLRSYQVNGKTRESMLSKSAVFYPVFTSEADHYRFTKEIPARPEDVYHRFSNVKRHSHSMTEKFIIGAIDGTDMDSSSQIKREWADLWHAAGGRVINYAEPFPGAENPAWFRRKIGLEIYKSRYDGHMMHGFVSPHWNEFSDFPEDPAYKNFGLAYTQDKYAPIERLALVGTAEAYNDIRYATMLRQQAVPRLDSKDVELVKEAKRQLAWLESVDGKTYDMDAFRAGCALRILTMQTLIQKREENQP